MSYLGKTLFTLFISLLCCYTVQSQSRLFGQKKWKALHALREVPYHLPINELSFELTFESTIITPGRFAAHAESMLGLSGISDDTLRDSYLTNLAISLVTSPDPDARFVIQYDPNMPYPYVFKTDANKILTYAGSLEGIPLGVDLNNGGPMVSKAFSSKQHTTRIQPLEATELKKTAIVRHVTDSAGNRVEVKPVKEEDNDEKLARDIAGRILDLQSARSKLLSGYQEIPYSYDAISYMDQGLKEMQQAYLSLFIGDTVAYTEHFQVAYTPMVGQEGNWITLFRFDPSLGILPPFSKDGDVCKIRFTYASKVKQEAEVIDSIAVRKPFTTPMIFFREPLTAHVEVMLGSQRLMECDFLISQLGEINALPLKGMDITMDPRTGAPLKIYFRDRK